MPAFSHIHDFEGGKRGTVLKKPDELKLWDHQARAVDLMARYFNKRREEGDEARSALVNVPTGGGKTAIIGTLAHWHPKLRRVLVLAPRRAIRDQLVLELGGKRGFLLDRGFGPEQLPRKVLGLANSASLTEAIAEDGILVSTIQMIDDMKKHPEHQAAYRALAEWCDGVFVDEGHYEPARSWSRTIRELKTPTVLVTATPYRNDLKFFHFDRDAIHISRYHELVEKGVLRSVEVMEEDPKALQSIEAYLDSVMGAFVAKYGELPSSARKLIIRCDGEDTVHNMGLAVRAHKLGAAGVIGLHENFKASKREDWEFRQPPDPEKEGPGQAAIWIHQHKLLEGVDGPSFRAVAFYDVRGSARALVQQIGRVVRNPGRKLGEQALMIDHSHGFLAASWKRYLCYDQAVTEALIMEGTEKIARDVDQAIPEIIYVERQFRERFIHRLEAGGSEGRLRDALRLPQRCHLLRVSDKFEMTQVAEACRQRCLEEGWPSTLVTLNGEELIFLFTKVEGSPLLSDFYHMDRELKVVVARKIGDVLVYLDTSRPFVDRENQPFIQGPLPRARLARVLTDKRPPRIVQINTRNAALGPSTVRTRAITAESLEDVPPMLDDYQFVASNIRAARRRLEPGEIAAGGEEAGFTARTIGFARGGISDAGPRLSLDEWAGWSEDLVAISSGVATTPSYLDRFAKALDAPPPDPRPRSILLDLDGVDEMFETAGGEGLAAAIAVDIGDSCIECEVSDDASPGAPRKLEIIANGVACPATLRFVGDGSYELVSERLERAYRKQGSTRSGNLVDYLNVRQAFTVLPETPNVVYADSGFYDPRIRLGPEFTPAELGLGTGFEHIAALRGFTSEKGEEDSATPDGWAQGSLFRWIDENHATILPDAELVLCDDGQREFCDFLLVGTRAGRHVVQMVHAKAAAKGAWVSASKLHEICGQAAKQVGMLALFGPLKPTQIDKWSGSWEGPSGEGTVDSRIRVAKGEWTGLNGEQIWTRLEKILTSQDAEREVVLVLGACLNRDRLFSQARKDPPTINAAHAVHLIRATMAAVASVGARLRILCG